jgi:hypothetical protein
MNYRGWMFIRFSRQYPKAKVKKRMFQNEQCLERPKGSRP